MRSHSRATIRRAPKPFTRPATNIRITAFTRVRLWGGSRSFPILSHHLIDSHALHPRHYRRQRTPSQTRSRTCARTRTVARSLRRARTCRATSAVFTRYAPPRSWCVCAHMLFCSSIVFSLTRLLAHRLRRTSAHSCATSPAAPRASRAATSTIRTACRLCTRHNEAADRPVTLCVGARMEPSTGDG